MNRHHPTMHLTRRRLALLATLSSLAWALSACGGGGHDPNDSNASSGNVTETVPANVSTDATAATVYTTDLADTTEAEGDTLEPVAVPDQLAADDSAEPA